MSENNTSSSRKSRTASFYSITSMQNFADNFFLISRRGSSLKTEVAAGASAFLATSYIFVVNPAVLSHAGIDRGVSLFATIIISASATMAMGLWARLPFIVSTGMEMNAFIAFFVVNALGFSWQQALGMVFWAGVVMTLVTLTALRERIIDSIPDALKLGLSFSVGIFLVLIAFRVSNVLVYDGLALVGIGSILSPPVFALCFCLACIALLDGVGLIGSALLSIIATAGVLQLLAIPNDTPNPPYVDFSMLQGVAAFDLCVLFQPKALSVILVLFILDFYGSIAKIITLARGTTLLLQDGQLPRRKQALLVDGVGTAASAGLGTTSVVVFVESAVGVGAGGRTGLVAVVCASLMFLTFIAAPALKYIPITATTGVLIYVGLRLCPSFRDTRLFAWYDRVALASMPLVTVVTFSIDRAMLAGFVIAIVGRLVIGRCMPNQYLIASTLLLALGVMLQVVHF